MEQERGWVGEGLGGGSGEHGDGGLCSWDRGVRPPQVEGLLHGDS
jgi:hypothetical protein